MGHENGKVTVTERREPYTYKDIKPYDDRHHSLSARLIAVSKASPGLNKEVRNQARRHLNHAMGWNDKAGISTDSAAPLYVRWDLGYCFLESQCQLEEAERLISELERSKD